MIAVTAPDMVPDVLRRELIETFEAHPDAWRAGDERGAVDPGWDKFTACPVPADLVTILDVISLAAAEVLDAEYGQGSYRMGRYEIGGAQGWHIDWDPTSSMGTRRTFSWSLVLNQQGVDFEGGDFELDNDGVSTRPQLDAGGMVAFSARQPHRVLPVTSGRRYVVIAFCGRA
jgi:hypothetical protein